MLNTNTIPALLGSILLLVSGNAMAADLGGSMKDDPVYETPSYNWSGGYVGINAGAAFGRGEAETIGTAAYQTLIPLGFAPAELGFDGTGFTGGAQAGYNIASSGVVYGIEGDINYVGLEDSNSFTSAGSILGTQLTTSASSELNTLATLRARLGVLVNERALLYVTGGLAVGSVDTRASVQGVQAPTVLWEGSSSTTKAGWTLGGGGEFALSNKMSFKVEGLYYDLGEVETSALGNATVRSISALDGIDYVTSTDVTGATVRAGLNFKF
jgi:outer membrane immunogenic protein